MTDEQNTPTQDENKLIAERRQKLAALREQGNPFPNGFRRDSLAAALQADYGDKSKEELEELGQRAKVAGRIMARRGPFMVLQDMTGRIQVYADKEVQKNIKHWDIGDIVGVEGVLHKSGKGELYVMLVEYVMETTSGRPVPEEG